MPTPEQNRAVIEDFCKRAAVEALADLVREHDGALVLPSASIAEIEAPAAIRPFEPEVPRMRYATVTAVPEVVDERTRWQRTDKLLLTFRVVGVLAALGLVGAIVWIAVMLIEATVVAVTAAAPTLLTILVVGAIILVLLGMGGGGGRGFSGTFSGRMH